MHSITETKGPPPKPTRDELVTARARYEARIPAQELRVIAADRAVLRANAVLDAAKAEQSEATAARERLATYIADLTAQIGA